MIKIIPFIYDTFHSTHAHVQQKRINPKQRQTNQTLKSLKAILNKCFYLSFKGVIWCNFKFVFLFGVLQAVCA